MAIYQPAPPEVTTLVKRLLHEEFPTLGEARITTLCQFAYAPRDKNGEPRGPALKYANYPAAAIIRVTPLKDRVAGLADARILIDGDGWPEWHDRKREGLIYHELTHLELCYTKDGELKTDDIGRPKLKLRPHDWQLGGFQSVVDRYGTDSFDGEYAAALFQRLEQQLFEWAK